MPDVPIIDAHVHLWDPAELWMPWLESSPLNKQFWLKEYSGATEASQIEGIVYLEVDVAPAYALIEARQIIDIADVDSRVMGIIPFAPLEAGDHLAPYLHELRLLEIKDLEDSDWKSNWIKGVRRITQAEADPKFCLQPGFVRGAQMLGSFGLTCDLCCNYTQLEYTVELVRQCPETAFIMDHIAKPNIRNGQLDPWRSQMADLASLPNCWCKISGVVTEANHDSWTTEDVKPFVLHALEVFGEDRVVFGGDWPVVLGASSWQRWVDALDELTADLSDAAKRKLWNENARAFYRLSAA
ncbi:MAG: amidohydrolase family protein [Thermomicrobiales bacterium]